MTPATREPSVVVVDPNDRLGLIGLVAAIDRRLDSLSRAGLVAPHQACDGAEAVLVGIATAVQADDWIFWGRQVNVAALVRGLPLHRLFAYELDMSSAAEVAALKVVTVTQGAASRMPHASGLAWAARRDGVVAVCELGDAAVSDPDFHVGLNFAGVLAAPAVFVVRSHEPPVPVAARGEGYGVRAVTVDGHDVEAVHTSVQEACERARRGEGPSLIEAIVSRGFSVASEARVAAVAEGVEAALALAELDRGRQEREGRSDR